MPTDPSSVSTRTLCNVILVCGALTVALPAETGCHSPAPGRPAAAAVNQPRLAAQSLFFGDTLLAEATLEPASIAGGPVGRGGRPGHGGGGRHGGHRGGPGGPPPDGGESDAMGPVSLVGAPSGSLHLRLTNRSQATLELAVTDVSGEIGNFAIHPDRLALAPGQAAEIDPLGISYPVAISELSMDVRIRSAGRTETQTLRLVQSPVTP